MKLRILLFSIFLVFVFSILAYLYWQQEIQYLLPTPKPSALKEVEIGDKLNENFINNNFKKGVFVHFFNGECPCSRFNIKDFKSMYHAYREQIDFEVVIQCEDCEQAKVTKFKNLFNTDIKVKLDPGGKIAASMGIYSTPQAVMLDSNRVVYYKGNYNKARFCTSKNTAFAEKALASYVQGKPAPVFPELAYVAYGCTLPANQEKNEHDLVTGFFKKLF